MRTTNFEHLLELGIFAFARTVWNYYRDTCVFCPKEREHRCDENCEAGLREWLRAPYIPSSDVWKEKKKK